MGFAAIALNNPKCIENVGGVLRAAYCFGAKLVVTSGLRYKRSSLDTSAAFKHIPFLSNVRCLQQCIPWKCVPVAVELVEDAVPLPDFTHPKSAYYVFGAEDQTLGQSILSWCPLRVQIPAAMCLNLAACVNVVLYDRKAKESRQ